MLPDNSTIKMPPEKRVQPEPTEKRVEAKAPEKRVKPKWLTDDLKNAINVKSRLFKKFRSTKSDYDFERYKAAEKAASRVIRDGKRKFERYMADKEAEVENQNSLL